MKSFMLAIAVICCASHGHADAVITGLVQDATKRPVPGAKVSVIYLSRRPPSDPLHGSTIATEAGLALTDGKGRFEIPIRAATDQDIALELSAHIDGQGVALADLPLKLNSHEITLTLPAELRIPAILLGPDGQPLPRAQVKVSGLVVEDDDGRTAMYSAPTEGVAAWPGPYASDDEGRFTLIAGGSIREVRLDIDDERAARQRWMASAAKNDEPLILRAEPPRVITGQVIAGDTREPLAGANVVITAESGDEAVFVGNEAAMTDAQGRFTLRPFVGDTLSIRVAAPDERFDALRRTILWLPGTTTQRMILPIYGPGFHPVDGTTADGRQATTIDDEFPDCEVTEHRPGKPLTEPLSGTIIADISLTRPGEDEPSVTGVVAIDAATGRWRLLADGGHSPRVSPDGKRLAYIIGRVEPRLEILDLDGGGPPRTLVERAAGPAAWLPSSQELITNIEDAAPRDYLGQVYWPLDASKRRFDLAGAVRATVPAPPPYDAYDVSPDGRWLAMHWDTHASETAAQLYRVQLDRQDRQSARRGRESIATGESGDVVERPVAKDSRPPAATPLQPIARRRFHYYWYPRFRPDGAAVLAKHLSARGGQVSVRVIELDGSAERDVALDNGYVPDSACWSPDGAFIAIAALNEEALDGGPRHSKLLVVNAAGTHLKEISLADVKELRIGSLDWTAARLVTD